MLKPRFGHYGVQKVTDKDGHFMLLVEVIEATRGGSAKRSDVPMTGCKKDFGARCMEQLIGEEAATIFIHLS